MTKAVFLDRDGTINVDTGYGTRISDLDFEKNAIKGLKAFQDRGYVLVIISNQGGIARGRHTEEEAKEFNAELARRLETQGVRVRGIYYCPHYEKGSVRKYAIQCRCRKPELGLVEQALKDNPDIDLSKIIFIGDKKQDIHTGRNAGCLASILVKTGKGGRAMPMNLL